MAKYLDDIMASEMENVIAATAPEPPKAVVADAFYK